VIVENIYKQQTAVSYLAYEEQRTHQTRANVIRYLNNANEITHKHVQPAVASAINEFQHVKHKKSPKNPRTNIYRLQELTVAQKHTKQLNIRANTDKSTQF
jgi:hypothetical protein